MVGILLILAALVWIAAGCYVIYAIVHLIERCDKVIDDMAEDEGQIREELRETAGKENDQ